MSIMELERILKALANPRRLFIVKYLKIQPEASVWNIAATMQLSYKATSKHLLKLAACGILEKDQRGLEVFYRLGRNQPPIVEQIITIAESDKSALRLIRSNKAIEF